MQNKGLIKFLLIVLIIVSVIQCLYIIPTRNVEKKADEYAQSIAAKYEDPSLANAMAKEARVEYLDSVSSEVVVSSIFKKFTYDELKSQTLALGLDLKGGQSATLQVDLKDFLITLADGNKNPDFRKALDDASEALKSSQSDYITLFGEAFRNLESNRKLNAFYYKNLSEELNTQSSDGEVIRVLREKADETVSNTYNLLKQRIDKLGVTQPNISLDANRDLILAELPGISNPERAKKMLQASANLEFWETYRFDDNNGVFVNAMIEADRLLKNESLEEGEEIKTTRKDTVYDMVFDSLGMVIDSTVRIEDVALDPFEDKGPLLSIFNLNSVVDGSIPYVRTSIGAAEKNKRKAVMELLSKDKVKALFPADVEFMWAKNPTKNFDGETTKEYPLYLIKKQSANTDKARLEGDKITSASAAPNPIDQQIEVSLNMNSEGAKIWADMTTKAAQGNREIAITLDDEVITAPSVNNPITEGRSSITGGFTMAEASDLSKMLEIGKLPAKLNIIQQSNVGPSLGQENIRKSSFSLLAGVILLLLFMIFYYGGAGIVSIIALLANLFFIFGALASFGAVLTLPGVAGIVLTIGMAVDANVIIFERIREELRVGKGLLLAISDGFKNSYSAIIDANVTTLLVAAVLAYFGLGPIKGFAIILIIGVIMSLFTAVLLGRLIIDWWTTSRGKNLTFWTSMSKGAFANMNIDWIGKRKIAYAVSGIIIVAGLVSMVTRGFDLGVDFRGGYSYNIQFAEDQAVSADELRVKLSDALGDAQVKAVDTENTYNVVTSYLVDQNDPETDNIVISAMHSAIAELVDGDISLEDFKNTDAVGQTHITSSSKVNPTIADDIKSSSYKAGTLALLLIFLYIFARFSKWQYSLGAVAALTHDSLVVLGLFSLLWGFLPISLELDQAFIAAILTVIGYSINDTVVVFDRIREYIGIYTNKTTDEVLNLALNSTFSRTVITSFTTLLMVTILLIFGGTSTRGFAFALMIGILVGTYSSIFVATPIVRDLSDDLKAKKTKTTKKSFSRGVGV